MDIEKLKEAVEALNRTNEAMRFTISQLERLQHQVNRLRRMVHEKGAEIQRLSNLKPEEIKHQAKEPELTSAQNYYEALKAIDSSINFSICNYLGMATVNQIDAVVGLIGQTLFDSINDYTINLHITGFTIYKEEWHIEFEESVWGDRKVTYNVCQIKQRDRLVILKALEEVIA